MDSQENRLKANRSEDGTTVQIALDGRPFIEIAWARLQGARALHEPGLSHAVDCGMRRRWESLQGGAQVEEQFFPMSEGLRWTLEMEGDGTPWGTTIQSLVRTAGVSQKRIWAPWGDTRSDAEVPNAAVPHANAEGVINDTLPPPSWTTAKDWSDPLLPVPFRDRLLVYGAHPFEYETPRIGNCPYSNDNWCIPLVTVLDNERDTGLSIILSPEDEIWDLTLETRASGELILSRMRHRIAHGIRTKWTTLLVVHEADWRGGMRWMARKYPGYFEPKNPRAHDLAGTGAYSCHDAPFGAAKLKKMAFRTNWRASFDFPYMGMFLPPVATDVEWMDFKKTPNSIARMEGYAKKMREAGFHVLSYFNVFEFGAHVAWPLPKATESDDDDAWKNCHAYLARHFLPAVLLVPNKTVLSKCPPDTKQIPGEPYYTWEDGIVMDCAEPAYHQHLLDQARRHIAEIPSSDGICIDRLDWVRMYNEQEDDGKSWFEDKPVRSLVWSWNRFMKDLGPLMHEAGKVIFLNNLVKRLDLLDQVDGIFDEYTYAGSPLNTSALLGIFKPVLGWTGTAEHLKPDPDAFFQRFLHMGVHPMAPFPGNDHSLQPSDWVDAQYLAYGPLLDAIRGRRWVLHPHAVEVKGGSAKAIFSRCPTDSRLP